VYSKSNSSLRNITREEVFEAAHALLMEGSEPTGERIRFKLGSRGSFGTIYKYLNEWKEENPMPQNTGGQTHHFASLPDSITKAVADVYEKIRSESEAENRKVIEHAEAAINQARQENEQAQVKVSHLQKDLTELKLKNNHLETDLTLANKALTEEQRQMAALKERADAAEKLAQALKIEMFARLEELKDSHQTTVELLKNQLDMAEKKHRQEVNKLMENNEKQRHTFMVENDQLKVTKDKLEKTLVKIEEELKQQKMLTQEANEKHKEIEVEYLTQKHALHALKQAHNLLEKDLVALKTEYQQKDILIAEFKALTQQLTKGAKKKRVIHSH